MQQRRNSYEDGVYGTTCPIPPGKNFTYILQMKDQIGSYFYFPSTAFHKAAGGFGGIRIVSRPRIPVPFDDPANDFLLLIGDWYKANHTVSITFPSTQPVSTYYFVKKERTSKFEKRTVNNVHLTELRQLLCPRIILL